MTIQTTINGVTYYTNESGRGIFTSAKNRETQLIGTNDAPRFATAKKLNAWIHRHLDV